MVCIETDRGPWSGRWPWLAIGCMQWIPGRPPGTGSCCRCRGPRVTRLMRSREPPGEW